MRRMIGIGTLLAASGGAVGQAPTGFTLAPGYPVQTPEPHWNGGLFVDMDGDSDLEFVASTWNRMNAFNTDGSVVPGWFVPTGFSSFSAPAWGDIDGDGQDEVVYNSFFFGIDSELIAIEKDGSYVPGFPRFCAAAFKSPSLADLDGDGDVEIIVNGNENGLGTIEVYDGDGTMLPGFPFSMFDITSGGTVSVADIDNDGVLELVCLDFTTLWVLEADGSEDPGFPNPWSPPDFTHAFNSYAGAALVDLDGDGDLEMVFHTSIENQNPGGINTAPQIHVLHHDGTPMSGWPVRLPIPNIDQAGGGATTIHAPVSVADIDNDGSYDIVVGDVTLCPDDCTVVMAWDVTGEAKPGFPITGVTATQNQIAIADIDGDGTMELFKDNNRAANPIEAFNHDGTPLVGWEFNDLDGSGQITFGDVDKDGFMDLMAPAVNITTAAQRTRFYLYQSDTVPWSPEAAPVAMYQYNPQRTGVVPPIGGGPSCPADVNGDGILAPNDFSAWVIAFNSQAPGCDQNGDGLCLPTDLSGWILNFNAGCP